MQTKHLPAVPGVYKITHLTSGRVYIGSSINVRQRAHAHRSSLTRNMHANAYLQRAWNEYGAEAFAFEVTHVLSAGEDLHRVEQSFMDAHFATDRARGFNLIPNAMAFEHTDETKRKIGESSRGRKHTPDAIEKLREHARNRASEHVAKLSAYASNRTQEHRDRLGAAHRGKVISEQQRATQSELMRGVPKTPEHRERIRAAHLGKPVSESQRAAIQRAAVKREAAKRQKVF